MARAAVQSIGAVESVATDMNAHTLTVRFDDEATSLEDIVGALNGAGYTVPEHRRVETDG